MINDEGRGGYGFVCKGIDLSVKLHVCVFMHLRSVNSMYHIYLCIPSSPGSLCACMLILNCDF